MRFTRRYWGVAALTALLAVAAATLARPTLFVGAVGLLAWLLARQFLFVREAGRLAQTLGVTQSASGSTTVANRPTEFEVSVELPQSTSLNLSVAPNPPESAVLEGDALQVPAGADGARVSQTITWTVAGRHDLPPPTVTAADGAGLFVAGLPVGSAAGTTVTVAAPRPEDGYVSGGGTRSLASFELETLDRSGPGQELGEVRQYLPGDSATHIDWKATARQNELHVREFDPETKPATVLVLDARARLQTGPSGRTKLDYLRQVALSLVDRAQASQEPLGLYIVGDPDVKLPPTATRQQYRTVQERLYDLSPGSAAAATVDRRTSGRVDRAQHALRRESSAFADSLRPFFVQSRSSAQAATDDPLYRAVADREGDISGAVRTVLLTDDADQGLLRQVVRRARRDGSVVVFATPTALFDVDPGTGGGLDDVRERLGRFERFRSELEALGGVSAYEVGPQSSLKSVRGRGDGGTTPPADAASESAETDRTDEPNARAGVR